MVQKIVWDLGEGFIYRPPVGGRATGASLSIRTATYLTIYYAIRAVKSNIIS